MNDTELLTAFEASTLLPDQWHHADHIRIAWLYLQQYPEEQAMDQLRAGLKRLIQAFGVIDAPDRGYHETVTRAWLKIVAAHIHHYGSESNSTAFLQAHPHLQRTLLRAFYSPDQIRMPEAKHRFIEPDLTGLPG
jgi:hypothetical protein